MRLASPVGFKNEREALRSLTEKLRQAAIRPNINGYVPYIDPKTGRSPQLQFHSSKKKGKLFIGGNRSGKTVGGAAECVMRATGKHRWRDDLPPPPVRLRGVTVDLIQGLSKIMLPEIARWIPPSELINGSWEDSYNKSERTLTLANESFIEFLTYEQDVEKFAGTSRHGVWFDEEPPQEIFNECMMRLIDTGGDWWMTMTPVEGMTWVEEVIYNPDQDNSDYIEIFEVDMEENPYIGQTEREMLMSTMDADDIKARKQGKFVNVGGLIYPNFKPDIHTIPPFTPPKDWLWIGSMDHGFTNPTSWHWSACDPDGRLFIFAEHYESRRTVSHHAQVVNEKNREFGRIPDYYVGDPSIRNSDPITATSVLLEYLKYDIPILLGNNDFKAGINAVSERLDGYLDENNVQHPTIFFTSDCVELLREIKKYRFATWAHKKDSRDKNPKEEAHKKNDHACDDIRYLVASRPEQGDDGTYVPEPNHEALKAYFGVSRSVPSDEDGGVTPNWLDEPVSSSTNSYDVDLGDDW